MERVVKMVSRLGHPYTIRFLDMAFDPVKHAAHMLEIKRTVRYLPPLSLEEISKRAEACSKTRRNK